MINKKIILFIFGILLIGIITGALISFSIINVSYPSDIKKIEKTSKTIIFNCDSKEMDIIATEPDNNFDEGDLLYNIRKVCDGEITNIQMDGMYWKTNKNGMKSFNETELKIDECSSLGYIYDYKSNDCKNEEY